MASSTFKFSPATYFISPVCPYAQRVSIALLESGLIDSIEPKENPSGIKLTEIDLRNKPEWYIRDINPSGKVPAFQITLPDQQKTVLVESDLITQFLMLSQASSLYQTTSSNPYLHYKAQMFLTQFQSFTSGFYTVLKAKQPEQEKEATAQFLTTLRTLSTHLDPKGPFSLGSQFLWTDVLSASFLMRLPVLKHYRKFEVPTTPEYERFLAWVHACSDVSSVRKSTAPLDQLIATYSALAN